MSKTHYLPHVILAGAPKCGSTSLFRYLSSHREVCASRDKETRYMIDEGYPLYRRDSSIHLNGWEGYHQFFDCDDQARLRFEATPDYLYQQTPLKEIPTWPFTPKIIFVLRDPAERVYSLFRFAQNNMAVLPADISFSEFLRMIEDGGKELAGRTILKEAVAHGHYVNYLEGWDNVVGCDNINIILFENLVRSPAMEMDTVAEFLGIDPQGFMTSEYGVSNPTLNVRFPVLHRVKQSLSRSMPLGSTVRHYLSRVYRAINSSAPPARTEADRHSLRRLRMAYASSNKRLALQFGLDLSPWQ